MRDEQVVSLLWPTGGAADPAPSRLDEHTLLDDLDLRGVVRALAGRDERREPFIIQLLQELEDRPEVIQYRQEILADLLENAGLRERIAAAFGPLSQLIQDRELRFQLSWPVAQIAHHANSLQHYLDVADQLRDALEDDSVRARGLRALRDHLRDLATDPPLQQLRKELPGLRATLEQVGSITIGINFNPAFLPESATLISINPEQVAGREPLLGRLFGKGGPRGISPLYDLDIHNPNNLLYREVRRLIEVATAPVTQALRSYTQINAFALNHLERELSFYLNAVALVEHLTEGGLPTCLPEIAAPAEGTTQLDDAYNLGLALRLLAEPANPAAGASSLVLNDVAFGDSPARIWILTGPNRGGKTTYVCAAGQAQVLFQAGLPVPARHGRLSPVDAIYTHFPEPEAAQLGMGRLDDEADRLARIFHAATGQSLVLLNEVLAGTSAFEALALAIDVVRGLRLLGARAIYTTHLHELALRVDEINAGTPGESRVGSLVAEVDAAGDANSRLDSDAEHRRTYRIVPGPPRGSSYASDIARRHGISFPQLAELFRERDLVP